jgi:hypothetical protein
MRSKSLANYAYKEKLKKCEDYIKKFKSVVDALLASKESFVYSCETVEGELQTSLMDAQCKEEQLTLINKQAASSMVDMEVRLSLLALLTFTLFVLSTHYRKQLPL